MKLRKEKIELTDDGEREAVHAVQQLARETGYLEHGEPAAGYFSALMVRTNETIDRVTSGRALSISWLARVAVPGVVGILFFFIGLHYYVPERSSTTISEAVKSLSAEDIDSLAINALAENSASDLQPDVFEVSNEQLADFYVSSASPVVVLESLSEQQQKEVASILESRFTNL